MSRWAELRDQALAEQVLDRLENDRRLVGCRFNLTVDGGVAHLTGMVGSDEERRLVRRLAASVRGIHAVWDLLRVPDEEQLWIVDLGCGKKKQRPWAIGVDLVRLPAVDLLANVDAGLPFRDNSVDQVFTVHVLEHVQQIVAVMNEIHRVLKPGGVLHIMVPFWQHVVAVADPTHIRYFSPETFKWFCEPHPGVSIFSPLAISHSMDSVFADLEPVKGGEGPTDFLLAQFFE